MGVGLKEGVGGFQKPDVALFILLLSRSSFVIHNNETNSNITH